LAIELRIYNNRRDDLLSLDEPEETEMDEDKQVDCYKYIEQNKDVELEHGRWAE